MNFDFSDDQKLLKEQVRKFLADKCPMKVVRRVLDGNETHADEVWKGLVELGVPATAALKLAGSEAQKKKWLPLLAEGKAIGTLAVAEGPQPPKPRTIATTFGGGRLSGKKVPVADGEAATFAVVLAKNELVLVDLAQKGVA